MKLACFRYSEKFFHFLLTALYYLLNTDPDLASETQIQL